MTMSIFFNRNVAYNQQPQTMGIVGGDSRNKGCCVFVGDLATYPLEPSTNLIPS